MASAQHDESTAGVGHTAPAWWDTDDLIVMIDESIRSGEIMDQDELIVALQKNIAEWERLFKDEQEYPTLDEVAQVRAKRLYKSACKKLAEAQKEDG